MWEEQRAEDNKATIDDINMRRVKRTYHPFVRYCIVIYRTNTFHVIIMGAIILNVILLAFDSFPPPPRRMVYIFAIINMIFNILFVAECLLTQVAKTVTPLSEMFGMRKDLDRLSHLMGTAAGWGANQAKLGVRYSTSGRC